MLIFFLAVFLSEVILETFLCQNMVSKYGKSDIDMSGKRVCIWRQSVDTNHFWLKTQGFIFPDMWEISEKPYWQSPQKLIRNYSAAAAEGSSSGGASLVNRTLAPPRDLLTKAWEKWGDENNSCITHTNRQTRRLPLPRKSSSIGQK